MNTTPNIKEIRQLYNLTQEEFALALGITRELVNKMEKGKCSVSKASKLLLRNFIIERQSEISSQEMSYLGTPSQHSHQEQQHLPYHLERREQKKMYKALEVPLIGIKAQAGYIKGYEHVDYIDKLEKYSLPPGVHPAGAIWSYFEVDGDSMEPTFSAGDVILASMLPHEDWKDVKNFNVYIILTTQQLIVKRVYAKNDNEWILISDNEEQYPQIILAVSDIKQVWTFRRQITAKVPLRPYELKV